MARPAANYNPSKLDGGATSFVPLLYHNLGDLSRGFCHFLDYVVGQATTHQGGLISSPLTPIVYYTYLKKSIGNSVQNRDKYFS